MNKPNEEEQDADGPAGALDTNQAETVSSLKAIAETMAKPECTAEQLPELWQQVIRHPVQLRARIWLDGVKAMYRRCTTYPQHTEIAVVLSGMSPWAWHTDAKIRNRAGNLFEQAGPEQLQQALIFARQHPESRWTVREHILASAGPEQLTGPVIEQFDWCSAMTTCATMPDNGPDEHYKWRLIIEHIQQQLLEDDKNAWVVFLGIVEPGGHIGDTAELANAIEQNQRPS